MPDRTELPGADDRKRIRAAVAGHEVHTTKHWAGIMKRARETLGWSQGELGELVGTSQFTISEVENWKQKQSKYVPAICLAVGIPLPYLLIEDEFDERWIEVGRVMRRKKMNAFTFQLQAFEAELGIGPPSPQPPSDQSEIVASKDGAPGRRRRKPGSRPHPAR